jgi:PhoH-like ATPase
LEKFLLDTNILMRNTSMVKDLNGEVIIPSFVLEELDNLKTKPGSVGYEARKAVRFIKDNIKDIFVDLDEKVTFDGIASSWDESKMDNKILAVANRHKATVVSDDCLVLLKAQSIGLDVLDSDTLKDSLREGFTGIREIFVDETCDEDMELLSRHYQNENDNVYELCANEYLMIFDKNKYLGSHNGYDEYAKLDWVVKRWDGSNFKQLQLPDRGIIQAKNDYQKCALDLLYNKDIPIKILSGTYGSGKAYLAMKSAVDMLDHNRIRKMMLIRNPIGAGDEKIGFLPGTKEEKTADFYKPFLQYIEGGEFTLNSLITNDKIGMEIPYYLKGMSIDNEVVVIVDEAEDLDMRLLKLIGTRIGEGSSIVFCGDYKQAEKNYKDDNGLVRLMEQTKDSALVGCVCMPEDVRSDVSLLFANL